MMEWPNTIARCNGCGGLFFLKGDMRRKPCPLCGFTAWDYQSCVWVRVGHTTNGTLLMWQEEAA